LFLAFASSTSRVVAFLLLFATSARSSRADGAHVMRTMYAVRMVRFFALFFGLALIAPALRAQVAGELRGRVTDATSARPVQNGRVELSGRVEMVRTNADGVYVIRGLDPRSYTVSIRALGYAVYASDVDVSNGRTSVLDAALTPSASTLNKVNVRADRDSAHLNTVTLTRAMIEQSGRRDVGELLQTTPGVVVTQTGGPGQPSRLSIRGSSSGQVLVLVDGVPLNSALSGGADLSRVSLENVNQVTVRTGAQSARYGPRAMAGVIEIETRKPQHELSTELRGGALGERDLSLAAGESRAFAQANAGASVTGEYRTADGDFTFRLPSVRGGGEATRINADATTKSVLGTLSLDGALGSAALRGNWQSTDRGMAGSIVQPSSTGRQTHDRRSVGASAQGTISSAAWTAAADVTRDSGTFVDRSPPFGIAYHDTIAATAATASGSATVGSERSNVATGVELRTLDVSSTTLAANAPHWQSLVGEWASLRSARAVGATAFSWDGELSARVDQNSLTAGNTFSPRAATRFSRGALSLSFSLGAGYAPPTLSDQFFQEGVQVKANPSLRAERTRNDFETRVTLRETPVSFAELSADAAVYRSDIDGMILWFPDFRFVWSPTNYDVNRRGWEGSAKLAFPVARLEVQGGVNRNDVTYAGGVLIGQVAYRPRATENLHVAFAPTFARVDVTTRYVGTRRTIAGSSLNALDPYWVTDVQLSRTFVDRTWSLQAALGVDNALNQQAAMLVDYPFPTRTWTVSVRVRRSTSRTR
jgi:vitamin B12 transporter